MRFACFDQNEQKVRLSIEDRNRDANDKIIDLLNKIEVGDKNVDNNSRSECSRKVCNPEC